MPRGGKRTGAGAPKRNFNAVTRGNTSERMLAVYVFLKLHPDHHALAHELTDAGIITHPPRPAREAMRRALGYVWQTYFDCTPDKQSKTIKQPPSSASDLRKTKNCGSNSLERTPRLTRAQLRDHAAAAFAAPFSPQVENATLNHLRFSPASVDLCRRCSAQRDAAEARATPAAPACAGDPGGRHPNAPPRPSPQRASAASVHSVDHRLPVPNPLPILPPDACG
jgi:hypothetical protein